LKSLLWLKHASILYAALYCTVSSLFYTDHKRQHNDGCNYTSAGS
jgi:hypothetical protein